MAKEKDLSFSEGETWIISFALRNAAGQPLDLTGSLVEWAVEPTVSGGASLLVDSDGSFITITDAEAGLGTVSIPPANHSGVVAGEYLHELRATLADSTVTVQISGRLSVASSVFGSDGNSFGITRTGGLQLEFDSGVTDSDPGDGEFRFNNASPAAAAFIYVDLLDRFDVDITDWLAALDDSSTTAARGHIRFTKAANEAVWHEFLITGAVVTATGYRKIPVSYVDGGGSFSAGDIATVSFSRTGDTGATGATGADGATAGITYDFATETADADPGAGKVRANNADLSAATVLYVDDADRSANNHEATLLTWDDSTSTVKGHLLVSRASDKAQVVYRVDSITDASGYVKVGVAYVAGETSFDADDVLSLQFYRAGDAGSAGDDGDDGTDPGIRWTFDSSTTTADDPGTGDLRLNNATLASVTEIGLDDNSAETGLWWIYGRDTGWRGLRLAVFLLGLIAILWALGFPGYRTWISRNAQFFFAGMLVAMMFARIPTERLARTASIALPGLLVLYVISWPVIFTWVTGATHAEYRSIPIVVLMAAIVLCTASARGLLAETCLAAKPMLYLGEVSFGIYLLHRPAMYLWQDVIAPDLAGPSVFALIAATTLALAHLSYTFLEAPARRAIRRPAAARAQTA